MKRKNKVIIGAGIWLGLLGTGAVLFERRLNMIMNEKEMDERLEQYQFIEDGPIPVLTQAEKEKISDMIKGMSEAELEIVLQNIPAKMMFDEVLVRLGHYDIFATRIQDAMKYLPK